MHLRKCLTTRDRNCRTNHPRADIILSCRKTPNIPAVNIPVVINPAYLNHPVVNDPDYPEVNNNPQSHHPAPVTVMMSMMVAQAHCRHSNSKVE